jgi:hypothetical protein
MDRWMLPKYLFRNRMPVGPKGTKQPRDKNMQHAMGQHMTIAFDIDDTITCDTRFFAFLTQALVAAGHSVLVITFRQDRIGAENDLRSWNIEYTKLVTATVDDLQIHGVNLWKAHICRTQGVNVFFEDSAEVCQHVAEETLCLMPLSCHRDKLALLAAALRD